MLGRDLRLYATPRPAISGDDDLAAHVNAKPVQLFVVSGNSLVDVNDLRGYVSVCRIRVVRRQSVLAES